MDCRQYRNELSDAAAGALDEERRRALDEHLAQCAECAARLDRLKRSMAAIDRALAESAEAQPSAELLRGLHERLVSEGARSPRPTRISPRVLVATSAVLVLLAAAWLVRGRLAVSPAPVTTPVARNVAPPFRAAQQPLAGPNVAPPGTRPVAAGRAAQQPPAGSNVAPPFRAAQDQEPPQRPALHAVIPNPAAPFADGGEGSAFPRHPHPARRVAPEADRSIFAEAKIPPGGPALTRLVELIDSGKIDPKSPFAPMQTKIQPIVIQPIQIKPISIPPLKIGEDSGAARGQSSGPTHSEGSEAGANKERTP